MPTDKNSPSNKMSIKSDEYKTKAYGAIDEAGDRARNAVDTTEWKAKHALDNADESAQRFGDKIVSLFSRGKEQARRLQETSAEKLSALEAQIKDRPVTSALVAFGAGLVIARLLGTSGSRRSRLEA